MLSNKCRPLGVVLALMSFVVVFGMNVGIQASQINKNVFVDSITISKSEAFVDQSVDMHVTFSEKEGHEFAPGDQMVFDLPEELEGFVNNLDLEDYATVHVENRRAVITFKDIVAVKEHIRGTLTFSVHVRDVIANNQEKTIDVNLGTNIQNAPKLKLKGHKTDQNHPDSPASYKGGHVDVNNPYILHWYVVVNPRHQRITGDVLVTDQLSRGHIYLGNSFRIDGGNDVVKPKPRFSYNRGQGQQFQIYLPQELVSGHGITIHYQTLITRSGKKMKELDNKFFTQFRPGYNNPKDVRGSYQLANLLVKGNIIGDDASKDIEDEEEEILEATENEINVEEETLEGNTQPIPDVNEQKIPEKRPLLGNPNGKTEDGVQMGPQGTQPEVHIDPVEENMPVEPNVESLDEIQSDKGIEKTEDNTLENGVHGIAPEVQTAPNQEVVEKPKSDRRGGDKQGETKTIDNKSVEVSAKAAKTSTNQTTLPKTDSNNNVFVTIVGLLGMMFVGFVMMRRNK